MYELIVKLYFSRWQIAVTIPDRDGPLVMIISSRRRGLIKLIAEALRCCWSAFGFSTYGCSRALEYESLLYLQSSKDSKPLYTIPPSVSDVSPSWAHSKITDT